ncbi:MAG TPA: hypothetical protein DEG17_06730 [Cyanobacteria bacterium UBA11149]|nr:hypothetical protein [Cyanobacteria bacterium UBA11367]HBE58219.1 hypothetical protein [Cyanobacteria bacterium UBA11366]HBK66922.1 hypothetical protein [Cyanobacteria bacterium UBA11166]HBR76169.1 hypothetical protein [Cyanobacteria bacterium UBA11159]HBS70744.1 hypothetical protein [Cyanobacteria bacterium UBA11153]HBW88564.1 hypothetical protein [Cyanobacteria bacterium UBA11149]HCA95875.1 hypothetical protein [Cyanobacteria bacterium UBA9226]
MISNRSLISVIVPAYNAAKFLEKAIQSILKQAYEPLEIIVVDDGSTDATSHVVKRLDNSIRYIYQENAGPAIARNTGLKLAKGEIIAFLDADDLWPENKLDLQLEYLEKNPAMEIITGRIQVMQSESTDNKRLFPEFKQPSLGVNLGAGLYRKSVFEKLGYFDPSLRQSEDLDFMMRVREAGITMVMLEEITLYYRLHETNITLQIEEKKSLILKAFKQSLNRRRQRESIPTSLPNLIHIDQDKTD